MLALCLAAPQADAAGVAEVAGTTGAGVLAGVAVFPTPEEFAAAIFAGRANATGAPAPRAFARLPNLPTRDACSGAIGAAGQPLIDAALEAEWTKLGARGALGPAAGFPCIVAVAAAALVVACAVAVAATQYSGKVLDAAGRAVASSTLSFTSTARIAGIGRLHAGLTNLMAAGASGARAVPGATRRACGT